jgi:hypothetical protein
MGSVRDSIRRGVAGVAEREAPKTEWTRSFLYAFKREMEKHFRKDPEGTVARIRTQYAHEIVDNPYGGKREFVSDWLEKNGFSDADAAEMRRRIQQHSDESAEGAN